MKNTGITKCFEIFFNLIMQVVQGGPERSRQSNFAVFAEEGGLNAKFPYVK